MKRRILFTVHSLAIGGIERSLIEMLRALDYDRFDVDVLLFAHQGELLPELPPQCRLLPEIPQLASLLQPIRRALRQGHGILAAERLRAKGQVRLRYAAVPPSSAADDGAAFALYQQYWENVIRWLPALPGEYDAAVSFMWPHHYVARKVQARRKLAWIHTDLRAAALDETGDEAVWRQFDRIGAVSAGVLEGLTVRYPALADRCFVFENLLSPADLRARAEAFVPGDMPPQPDGFRLLSIGRYCYAKAFELVPLLCRRLVERGLPVTWYLIGYGGMEEDIRRAVGAQGMEGRVVLLGKRENPCPYLKACDLYVQPSRYEGKAVSVMEALSLGKPVAVTAFPTAAAQVTDGVDARIVPLDPEAAAEGIAALLRRPEEMARLAGNAAGRDYSGYENLEKLYKELERESPAQT
ncbi:MAG: glycosyltransferase [Oscillospiraceae bacterium]|nr:glycosyltransferase [Oscillospiraceae bacterium]